MTMIATRDIACNVRTDAHRPGAMDPAKYRVLAYACVFKEEDLHSGREVTVCEMEPTSDEWEQLGKPSESTWSGHREHVCDHCGSRLKYECVVLHIPTGDIITMVGRDCVHRFFNAKWSLIQQRGEARARRQRNTDRFLSLYGDFANAAAALEWALTGDGRAKAFVHDIATGAVVRGWEIKTPQAVALFKAYELSLLPIEFKTGRRELSGVIVKANFHVDNYASDRYHTSYKCCITVLTEEGFRVYGTLPSQYSSGLKPGDEAEVVGRHVDFTATVEGKDAAFATYSRPAKFTIEARPGGILSGDPEATPEDETAPMTDPDLVIEVDMSGDAPEAPAQPAPRLTIKGVPCPADDASVEVWDSYFDDNRPDREDVEGRKEYRAAKNHWNALEDARYRAQYHNIKGVPYPADDAGEDVWGTYLNENTLRPSDLLFEQYARARRYYMDIEERAACFANNT